MRVIYKILVMFFISLSLIGCSQKNIALVCSNSNETTKVMTTYTFENEKKLISWRMDVEQTVPLGTIQLYTSLFDGFHENIDPKYAKDIDVSVTKLSETAIRYVYNVNINSEVIEYIRKTPETTLSEYGLDRILKWGYDDAKEYEMSNGSNCN